MLIIIILLLLINTNAKRTFFNEGELTGWDKLTKDGGGIIEELHTGDCYNGTSCLHFAVNYQGDSYSGRYTTLLVQKL